MLSREHHVGTVFDRSNEPSGVACLAAGDTGGGRRWRCSRGASGRGGVPRRPGHYAGRPPGGALADGWGAPLDTSKGVELILDSAAKNSAVGHRFAGVLYEGGRGVPRDYAKAIAEYNKAISLRDTNAFDRLGSMYMNGLGVAKSHDRARGLFTSGAAQGDSWAQLHLALMYENGPQTAKHTFRGTRSATTDANIRIAVQLLSASAAQGNQMAAYRLGMLYLNGPPSVQNPQAGVDYILSSATHRIPDAEFQMGNLLAVGSPYVPQDRVAAYVWLGMAADQQNNSALAQMESVSQQMTDEERAAAMTRLRRLKQLVHGE